MNATKMKIPVVEVRWGDQWVRPVSVCEIDETKNLVVACVVDRRGAMVNVKFFNRPRGPITWREK